MGEAKRRKQSDPTFGQKKKESWIQLFQKNIQKFSRLELFLWTLIIVSSITTVIWSVSAAR